MAMEEEDLSASVIFLAILPGNGHVFFSTASNFAWVADALNLLYIASAN